MTLMNLQQWIQHPEMLNRETLYELRTLVARYPYFQSLRLLYLKNLYLLHDINFGVELRKAILYIADRRKLFHLIEGERYVLQDRKKDPESISEHSDEPSVDRTLALIDAFLATTPEETNNQNLFDYSTDYTAFLEEKDELPGTENADEVKLQGHELIDSFLEKAENEPSLRMHLTDAEPEYELSAETEADPKKDELETPQEHSEEVVVSEEIKAEEEEDDSCFTETLAKIYIKQQRYSKALEIIKKLNLKFPKKNAYFADQIRFLEKLIINANSK